MKYELLKKFSAIAIGNVTGEVDEIDGSPRVLTLRSADQILRIACDSEYSSLRMSVPAKPKMVKQFQVSGILCKVNVQENFEDEYSANRRADELRRAAGDDEAISVKEIEVADE